MTVSFLSTNVPFQNDAISCYYSDAIVGFVVNAQCTVRVRKGEEVPDLSGAVPQTWCY